MILAKKYRNKSFNFELEFDFETNNNENEKYFSGHFKRNDNIEAIAGSYSIYDSYISFLPHKDFSMIIRSQEKGAYTFKANVSKDITYKPDSEKIDSMYVKFDSPENSETFKLLFEAI